MLAAIELSDRRLNFPFAKKRLTYPVKTGYIIARMKYEIILSPEAVADFKVLKANVRAAVRDAIEKHLRFEPTKESKSHIKKLRGIRHPQYRLRVDEIRVFYDIHEDRVEVLAIVDKSQAVTWLKNIREAK